LSMNLDCFDSTVTARVLFPWTEPIDLSSVSREPIVRRPGFVNTTAVPELHPYWVMVLLDHAEPTATCK
jgi:hypothetical protein